MLDDSGPRCHHRVNALNAASVVVERRTRLIEFHTKRTEREKARSVCCLLEMKDCFEVFSCCQYYTCISGTARQLLTQTLTSTNMSLIMPCRVQLCVMLCGC